MDERIIIFTSPSGAGKTTIVRHLLSKYKDRLAFSISATTRGIRKGEEEGVHYYFLSQAEFEKKIAEDAFLEWEQVYEGLYYGTLLTEIKRLNDEGKTAILDIDVKGAMNVKDRFGDNVFTVFVQPPSKEVLIDRLKNRGTEKEDELKKRIARMEFEMDYASRFDKVIVNDKLEDALQEAEHAIEQFLEHSSI